VIPAEIVGLSSEYFVAVIGASPAFFVTQLDTYHGQNKYFQGQGAGPR
jgi:hypothetical protein